jgi:predicted S18 family serine protease
MMAKLKHKNKKRGKKIQNVSNKSIAQKKSSDKFVNFLFFLVIFLLIFSLLNFALYYYQPKKEERITYVPFTPKFLSIKNTTLISMKIPAVDDKGNGITTLLVVEAMPGSGRTMVDIDNLLFWADTQQSIRLARLVAANITKLDINEYDLIYNIHANATVIGGESAGAAITIATIAALQNKSLNEKVMITGRINHDASIGPVSEIVPKAKASKDAGATLFLVPLLQSRDVVYETREHCEKFGPTKICSIEQLPRRINVTNQVGIDVKEVGSVEEALTYFFNE